MNKQDSMPAEVATSILADPRAKTSNTFRKEIRAARAQYYTAQQMPKSHEQRNRALAKRGSFQQLNKWARRAFKHARILLHQSQRTSIVSRASHLLVKSAIARDRAEELLLEINSRTNGNYAPPAVA